MKILITGSEGYIGAVLRDTFLAQGHDLVGLDTGYFRECNFHCAPTPIPTILKDIRCVELADLAGFDVILHLAALSNDPLGSLDPALTAAINTQASIRLAALAKEAGVSRFLFSSSCSIYGEGKTLGLTEEAEFHPQTPYAQSKVDFEKALLEMADDRFSPVMLRNATAYGLSPRLRFDIVVNNLVGWAWTTHAIRLSSDGTPWRPLVHVRDIARAFLCACEAPRETVHATAFNIGNSDGNLQIKTVAERVRVHFPDCEVTFGSSDGDARTYHVDFQRAKTRLPGFNGTIYTLDDAILELKEACETLALQEATFRGRLYTRLKQIEFLRQGGRLDDDLFWREP